MKTFIVDSFTRVPFRGNPAGVCLAEGNLDPALMQQIAAELGLSETAFVTHPSNQGLHPIRFFSPKQEIPLCGHATLAAGRVMLETYGGESVVFRTARGVVLPVTISGDVLQMVLPRYDTTPVAAPEAVCRALGLDQVVRSEYNAETGILMLEIVDADGLRRLAPDYPALLAAHDSISGVLVTAPASDDFDFHSRYFWPWSGTNEDPVTGGTHTFLAPYWAERLGKTRLSSFQSSARTGSMDVEVLEDTVVVRAHAVVVLEGALAPGVHE